MSTGRAEASEVWINDNLEPRHILSGDQLLLCLSCGALVGLHYTHAEWHLEMDARVDG